MTIFLLEYFSIGLFVVCSFLLALILLVLVYVLGFNSRLDNEKSSAYECGFAPFSETSFPFEVKFALVAILFLLFDIEVLYLYPLCSSFNSFSAIQQIAFLLFFIILTLGIFLEIMKNVLDLSNNYSKAIILPFIVQGDIPIEDDLATIFCVMIVISFITIILMKAAAPGLAMGNPVSIVNESIHANPLFREVNATMLDVKAICNFWKDVGVDQILVHPTIELDISRLMNNNFVSLFPAFQSLEVNKKLFSYIVNIDPNYAHNFFDFMNFLPYETMEVRNTITEMTQEIAEMMMEVRNAITEMAQPLNDSESTASDLSNDLANDLAETVTSPAAAGYPWWASLIIMILLIILLMIGSYSSIHLIYRFKFHDLFYKP